MPSDHVDTNQTAITAAPTPAVGTLNFRQDNVDVLRRIIVQNEIVEAELTFSEAGPVSLGLYVTEISRVGEPPALRGVIDIDLFYPDALHRLVVALLELEQRSRTLGFISALESGLDARASKRDASPSGAAPHGRR